MVKIEPKFLVKKCTAAVSAYVQNTERRFVAYMSKGLEADFWECIHGKSGDVRPPAYKRCWLRQPVGEGVKKKGSFLLYELHPVTVE